MIDIPNAPSENDDPWYSTRGAFDVAIKAAVQELYTASMQIFQHGSNANAIRPSTTSPVFWVGTVQPVNMQSGDVYLKPTVTAPPAGLVASWSVTDLNALANGATVSAWTDRVSSLVLTPTSTPTYDATNKYVVLDGVDDILDATLSQGQPTTTIAVFRLPGSLVSTPIVGSATAIHSISTNSSSVLQANNGTALASSVTATANTVYAITQVASGASSYVYSGRNQVAAGSAGTNARASVRIGANTAGTAFGRVDVKAVLVYSRALSASEISTVMDIINADLGTAF